MRQFLSHDLILLENQVPWMVLEILFFNFTKDSDFILPLILFAKGFFRSIYFSNRMPPLNQIVNIEDIKHFADLFKKISTLSSTDPQQDECVNIQCIKHFVDLFRKLSTKSRTLFKKLSSSTSLIRKFSTLSTSLFWISSVKRKKERRRGWEFLPSATRLVESGIKFKRGTSKSILDLKFNDAWRSRNSFI